jgi:hypothetical protein
VLLFTQDNMSDQQQSLQGQEGSQRYIEAIGQEVQEGDTALEHASSLKRAAVGDQHNG